MPTCSKANGWALSKFKALGGILRHYAHVLSLDSDLVRGKMSLLRAMLPDGPLSV